MIAALICGAGVGLGVCALVRGLRPPRAHLAEALSALRRHPRPAPIVDVDPGGWAARAGRPLARPLSHLGLPTARVRRDLAVVGRLPERHLAEKASAALAGLIAVPALAALLALAGATVALAVPLWGAVLLAAAGFVAPDLDVRARAARRREDFRHALSAFLDLTVVSLAGGAGVEGALADAATVGRGRAFTQIRRALDTARLARQPPWNALGQLGEELDVRELSELAAAVSLAGAEGAKVRASLSTKAAALRAHQLSEAESNAQAASERMALPVVLLFAGFLVFIGYPAIANVLSAL